MSSPALWYYSPNLVKFQAIYSQINFSLEMYKSIIHIIKILNLYIKSYSRHHLSMTSFAAYQSTALCFRWKIAHDMVSTSICRQGPHDKHEHEARSCHWLPWPDLQVLHRRNCVCIWRWTKLFQFQAPPSSSTKVSFRSLRRGSRLSLYKMQVIRRCWAALSKLGFWHSPESQKHRKY